MSCDNSYANTVQTYAIKTPFCELNAPSVCPYSSVAACESQCGSNQNQPCYDNCCTIASRAACEATVTANYGNRGSSYFSCMGFEGNLGNCVEQMEICPAAHGRYAECNTMYEGLDNADARNTCITNSGINQCV